MRRAVTIRRVIVFVLVWKLFEVGVVFAARPLVAEWYAGRAERLDKEKRWHDAIAIYMKATDLAPYDAKYHAAIGRAYLNLGKATGHEAWWRKARTAYAKAIELSPANARYRLGWGEAEANIVRAGQAASQAEIDTYVANFRTAVELNPNSYYVNASAGFYILLMKDRIGEKDRNWATYRLRYALELNPGYANQIFSFVANGLGDFKVLEKITPKTPQWQAMLVAFLRDIDKWKYGKR